MPAPDLLRPVVGFTCPECGWSGEFEARFPAWCLACTYGANPDFSDTRPNVWRRYRRAAAARRNMRLFRRLLSARQLRPTGLLRASVLAFALLIHLTTLALAAGGVALIVTMPHSVRGWLGGPLVLLLAWYLRPRAAPGWDGNARWITAEQAPELFRLLDTLSDLMGADRFVGATLRAVDSAAVLSFGLRRRQVLMIGVPLWEVLAPQERLAVLAHEIGHSVNYDAEIGHVVRGALHTLRRWYALTHPLTLVTRNSRLRTANLVDLVLPFHLLHAGAVALLRRSKPRAEYLADHLAASVASTDAVCSAFERFPTARSAVGVVATALRARVPSHPWRMVRDYAAALPEHERRRLALIEERQGLAVDSTHPPTFLRLRMLRERPALPARLTLDAEWSAAIDAELAPHAERLAGRLMDFARR